MDHVAKNRSPAGREREQIEIGQWQPRRGRRGATDIVDNGFGRLGAGRAVYDPHRVKVLKSPRRGPTDPTTRVNQQGSSHLDQLAALLPDLAHHSPFGRLLVIETAAGQAPQALRAGRSEEHT